MNENHAELCSSAEWAAYLYESAVAPLTAGAALGTEMLEIGPGPGAATDSLRRLVDHLTVLEVDEEAAARLEQRFAGDNVRVLVGDACATGLEEASFDSVAAFTMLHHVPTVAAQDRILAEVLRVLRPGGVFIGSDSLPSTELHSFHEGDTYNPIEPSTLFTRFRTIGFARIAITVAENLTFAAHKAGVEAVSA